MTAYSKPFEEMSEDEKFVIIYAIDGNLDEVMAAKGEGDTYSIDIQVNGVPVSAKKLITRLLEGVSIRSEHLARNMVEDKFNELTETFQPIKDILDAAERKLSADLGIERDSWGDY